MVFRDLGRNIDVAQSLMPGGRNATATGQTIDLRGYDSAAVLVSFGTWTDGTHTPSLQHSNDGVTFNNVAATDMTASFTAVSSSGGTNTVQRVGYLGDNRYLRVVMTISGATTGALSAAIVVRGDPRIAPLP